MGLHVTAGGKNTFLKTTHPSYLIGVEDILRRNDNIFTLTEKLSEWLWFAGTGSIFEKKYIEAKNRPK